MSRETEVTKALLDRHGRTYAEEAGIRLADRPAPLYQLLVLTTLLSTRIRASVAIDAARELFTAGFNTPHGMARSTWQQRVDALGRAHYRRYDERTSTMLGRGAEQCLEQWRGDLRGLRREADGDVSALRRLLIQFPGIGPTGADIFLREAQAVWTDLRPYVDRKVAAGAQRLRLPNSPGKLAEIAGSAEFARLASALVRMSLDQKAANELVRGAPGR
jgi:endonuclease III